MVEIKTYLVDILNALEKDYEVENVNFELTDEGYVITFKADCEDKNDEHKVDGKRGSWYCNNEIKVTLGTKYFEAYGFSSLYQDICPCDNCKKEEKTKD